MYETQLPKDWTYILNDSECSALFCSTEDIFVRAVKEVLPNTPAVSDTFCFSSPTGEPHSLSTAINHVEGRTVDVLAPSPDDLAGLIYTSGTTGKPKVGHQIYSEVERMHICVDLSDNLPTFSRLGCRAYS